MVILVTDIPEKKKKKVGWDEYRVSKAREGTRN